MQQEGLGYHLGSKYLSFIQEQEGLGYHLGSKYLLFIQESHSFFLIKILVFKGLHNSCFKVLLSQLNAFD